jgi:hypothetical protein
MAGRPMPVPLRSTLRAAPALLAITSRLLLASIVDGAKRSRARILRPEQASRWRNCPERETHCCLPRHLPDLDGRRATVAQAHRSRCALGPDFLLSEFEAAGSHLERVSRDPCPTAQPRASCRSRYR